MLRWTAIPAVIGLGALCVLGPARGGQPPSVPGHLEEARLLEANWADARPAEPGPQEGGTIWPLEGAFVGGPVVLCLAAGPEEVAAGASVRVAIHDAAGQCVATGGFEGELSIEEVPARGHTPGGLSIALTASTRALPAGAYEVRCYRFEGIEPEARLAGRVSLPLTLREANADERDAQLGSLYRLCWNLTGLPIDPSVREIDSRSAASAIAAMRDESALPYLDHLARVSPSSDASDALAAIGTPRALTVLEALTLQPREAGAAARAARDAAFHQP